MKTNLFQKLSTLIVLTGICLFGADTTGLAQVYDPDSGATVYPQKDGGVVVYTPTPEGSTVTVCDANMECYEINCQDDPKGCTDALEDATSLIQNGVVGTLATKVGVRRTELPASIIKRLKDTKSFPNYGK